MFKPPIINNAGAVRSVDQPSSQQRKPAGETGFSEVFESALDREGIRLSKHARERIASREIQMNESDVRRIADAMGNLKGKGAKISLMFMGETTLVTNVDKRTVITALDSYGDNNKMFTQIDSAVFLDKG